MVPVGCDVNDVVVVVVLVCKGDRDEETEPVEVFETWVERLTVCVIRGERDLRVDSVPETEVVDVFEFDGLAVYVADDEVVLDLLDEPVTVGDCWAVFDMRALAVIDTVLVRCEVTVGTTVGEADCVVAADTVTLRLAIAETVIDAIFVFVDTELGTARVDTADVDDPDRVFVMRVEPEPVRDTGGVAVILMDAEEVTDAVEVLLPGRLLVYVGEVEAVLLFRGVLVVVLEPTGEAVVVEEPDMVFVLVTVLLTLGDAVPVFELERDPVLVIVARTVLVDPIDLVAEGDALEVFDACIDRVGDAEAVWVRDLAGDWVDVGHAVDVLEAETEPVVVLDRVVVLVVVELPVIVEEIRAVVVIRGDEDEVLEPTVERVEVIEAVTVFVEVVVGVTRAVLTGENERSDDRVDVLLAVELVVGIAASLTRKRPCVLGGPVTSCIVLSATLNVANRIRPSENSFILYWLALFYGCMNSLFH